MGLKFKVGGDNSSTDKNISMKVNEGAQQKSANKVDSAKSELYSYLVGSMRNEVSVDVKEDSLQASIKRYKQLQNKKRIILAVIVTFMATILIFGAYNTFMKHEWTGQEIAAYANYYNGKTNFPIYGLQAFLETHLEDLFSEDFTVGRSVTKYSIDNPIITDLGLKTSSLTNVYFICDITTNNSVNRVKCMVPVVWEDDQYKMGGRVMFLANSTTVDNVAAADNPYLSFTDIPKMDEASSEKAKLTVDQFFKLFYGGEKDLSTIYSGTAPISPMMPNSVVIESTSYNGDIVQTVSDGQVTYNGIVDWEFYTEMNKNGYNAHARISVTLPNDVTYVTDKYFFIESDGGSWKIKYIL